MAHFKPKHAEECVPWDKTTCVRELHVHFVGITLIICWMDSICITSFTCFYNLHASSVLPYSCHYSFLTFTTNSTLSPIQFMPLGGYGKILGKPLHGEAQQFEKNPEWDFSETSIAASLYETSWKSRTLLFPVVYIRTAFKNPAPRQDHTAHSAPVSNN